MGNHATPHQSEVSIQFERALLSIVRSRRRIVGVVFVFGVSTFIVEYAIHQMVMRTRDQAPAFADSLILGSLGALFVLLVLNAARDRHRKVQDDLRRIAELNHHTRNALQVIVYGEYSPHDAERRAAVLAGVEKIDTTLREMFPRVGERKDDCPDRPWEAHNRAHLQSHNLNIQLKERRRSRG
jgi:hypothetical protein